MAQFGSVRPMPKPPPHSSVEVDGAAIRRARQDLGQTITSFAPQVPMSVGYLSQIERGNKRMSPPAFLNLVRALGYTDRSHELRADNLAAVA